MGVACVLALLPGVFNGENHLYLMLFLYFLRKVWQTKAFENEQNIRTCTGENTPSESVGLYRECEYCPAEMDLVYVCIMPGITVPLLS